MSFKDALETMLRDLNNDTTSRSFYIIKHGFLSVFEISLETVAKNKAKIMISEPACINVASPTLFDGDKQRFSLDVFTFKKTKHGSEQCVGTSILILDSKLISGYETQIYLEFEQFDTDHIYDNLDEAKKTMLRLFYEYAKKIETVANAIESVYPEALV